MKNHNGNENLIKFNICLLTTKPYMYIYIYIYIYIYMMYIYMYVI